MLFAQKPDFLGTSSIVIEMVYYNNHLRTRGQTSEKQ